MSLDFEIAKKAALIRRKHKTKLGDSVIAATTLITKSALLTRNIKHFQEIKGITIKFI